ncbi:bacterioferritin [Polycladidibacter stylochi]|uniref:bacterioferritin n=1 Tax=Polycladidibacter stylochi TaxID=1807766 RepID=UPI00082BF7E7|nr:bacterioferritin [Pseudovibrio stylochi]
MKGNAAVIERLNIALQLEIGAVNMYRLHAKRLDDLGFKGLAAKELEESAEEQDHADQLLERILFLGGVPQMGAGSLDNAGTDLISILKADLAGEETAHASYKESREVCEREGDYVTMKLFDGLIADEEGHIDFLETQLELIETIGIQNYGMLNSAAANASE